jgi:hypothetical protein
MESGTTENLQPLTQYRAFGSMLEQSSSRVGFKKKNAFRDIPHPSASCLHEEWSASSYVRPQKRQLISPGWMPPDALRASRATATMAGIVGVTTRPVAVPYSAPCGFAHVVGAHSPVEGPLMFAKTPRAHGRRTRNEWRTDMVSCCRVDDQQDRRTTVLK